MSNDSSTELYATSFFLLVTKCLGVNVAIVQDRDLARLEG